MYRRLLKDASLYSVSSLVARGFSFITVPVYTRILEPGDYGALDLLSYMVVLVPLLVGMALDQAVARFYNSTDDLAEKKRIASSVIIYISLVFVLFIPFVGPVSTYLANDWLSGQVDRATVLLAFVLIWVHSIFYFVNNQLKYLFFSRQYAITNIGNTVVSIVSGFVFIVWFGMGVYGILLGQLIGQTLFALLSLYFGRASYGPVFHWPTMRKLLHYSLPLMPGTMAFFVMQYFDRYALNQLNGLHDVGIYGIGARIASLLNLFLMGFQGAWDPIVMRHFREKDAPRRFARVFSMYLMIVLSVLTMLSLFGSEILFIFTTRAYSEAYIVVPLLVTAAILASIGNYFTFGIAIARKSHYRLILNLVVLVINVVLNYTLIPLLGITGACLATALSFLVLALAGMTISQRLYAVPYRYVNNIAAVCTGVAVSCSVMFLDSGVTATSLLVKASVASVTVLLLSRLLDVPLSIPALVRVVRQADGMEQKS